MLDTGLESFTVGISSLNADYSAFDYGVQAIFASPTGGVEDIHNGAIAYAAGVSELSSGMNSYYLGVKTLPSETQKLIDGQEEFKDGIDEANEDIQKQVDEAMPSENSDPVSFISHKNHPSSVQYILLTPAIELDKVVIKEISEQEDKNIWDRFLDLFRD